MRFRLGMAFIMICCVSLYSTAIYGMSCVCVFVAEHKLFIMVYYKLFVISLLMLLMLAFRYSLHIFSESFHFIALQFLQMYVKCYIKITEYYYRSLSWHREH